MLVIPALVTRTPVTPAPSPLSVRRVVGGERWTPVQHHGMVTLERCVHKSAGLRVTYEIRCWGGEDVEDVEGSVLPTCPSLTPSRLGANVTKAKTSEGVIQSRRNEDIVTTMSKRPRK